jgi:putative membrane protein
MSNLEDPRVLFALERTALAWNRSGLALIAFGFLIEKSNLLLQLIDPERYQNKIMYGQWLGIAIIVFGMLVNIASILQYRRGLKALSPAEFIDGYQTQHPVLLNLFTFLSGISGFIKIYADVKLRECCHLHSTRYTRFASESVL